VGSDPNSFGQTVEGICTFADGSTKVVSNDEYAVTSIVGSLILGAILGVGIAVIFTPIYILQKKKATKVA
jgi:Ca2+/Na+ antiporter